MTWTTLPTYVDGTVLDASKLLAIRDNINETAAAKATTHCSYFTGNGANSIVERSFASESNTATGTRTLGTYGDLSGGGGTGPSVTVATYSSALVFINAQMDNSSTGESWCSYAVSGASGISALDSWAIMNEAGAGELIRAGISSFRSDLSGAGLNTFTMQYKVVGGGTGTFDERELIVMPL